MSLERESIIKFEEVEKRLHSLNKKVSNAVTTINTNLADLEQEIIDKETFNFLERSTTVFSKKSYNYLYVDRIFFTCKKGCLTKISVSADAHLFSSGATYTSTFYGFLNSSSTSSAIYTTTLSYNSDTDHTFTFDYEFYPTQENNFIQVRLNCGNTTPAYSNALVRSVTATITGRNIMFLNRKNDFKVFISKDYYYLTKNTVSDGYYLKQSSTDVDLSETFTTIPNLIPADVSTYLNKYFPFNYTYIPKIVYNSSTSKFEIDDSVTMFLFGVGIAFLILSGTTNPVSGVASLVNWVNKGMVYSVGHPGNNDTEPRNLAFAHTVNLSTSLPGLTNSNAYSYSGVYLTLNGSALTGFWVDNVPVFAKNWEDEPNNPYMSIATNDMGECYFFPAREATYTIYLGKGHQVSSYLNSDGTITVYMNWLDKVYKKTLIYNELSSQYELSETVTVYDNTSEIIEGYSTDYFICDLNRNWSYVPAT